MSMTVGSYYGGAGGLLLGFQQTGYEAAYIWDDRDFCKENYLLWPGLSQDPSQRVDVIVSSPPCKRFSNLAIKDKNRHDFKTEDLEYIQVFRKIEDEQPIAFVVENLASIQKFFSYDPGTSWIIDKEGKQIVCLATYQVLSLKLDSFDFGVPQHRKRLYLVGILRRHRNHTPFQFYNPIRDMDEEKKLTVGKALSDVDGLPNMEAPNHKPERIKGFQELAIGKSYYNTQNNLRIDPNRPSPTITSHRTAYVHPFLPRTLTVRETARLMGFPDDFIFYGPRTHQLDQVGCGVCPPVAKYLARWLRGFIVER